MTEAQSLTTKLTVLLAEVDQANGMTGQQLEALGNQLGELWRAANAAGNESAASQIALAWEQAQALNANAVDVNAKAVAIATVATEAILERDAALDQFQQLDDGLTEAETKGFSSHPRIGAVVNSLTDRLYEEWESEGLHIDCPGCAVCDSGDLPLIDHDAVNGLCHMLFGGWTLEAEHATELTEFINNFYYKVRDFEEARDAEAERRMAEEEAQGEEES